MTIKNFITGLLLMLFVGFMLTSCNKDEFANCGQVFTVTKIPDFNPNWYTIYAVDECGREGQHNISMHKINEIVIEDRPKVGDAFSANENWSWKTKLYEGLKLYADTYSSGDY